MELRNVEQRKQNRKSKIPGQGKPLHRMAWLETLFNALPEGVILTDLAGRVIYYNQTAISLLDQEPENVEPEAWPKKYGFFVEDEKTLYPSQSLPLVRALNSGRMESEEMILFPETRQSGIWISMTAQPFAQTEEGISGIIVMLRDISLRKRIEQSREKYAKRAETLYKFSYDFAESGLELEKVLNTVAESASHMIGDACVITLWVDSKLRNLAATHPKPAARTLLRDIALSVEDIDGEFIRKVMDSGEPLLIPTLPPEAMQTLRVSAYAEFIQEYGIQSIMITPLKGRHGIMGTMSLSRDGGRPGYTSEDQSFSVDLAYRASLAIENCRLFDSLLEEMEERISAKKAQEESEERLRSIFESTALGIKILNLEGKILQTNPALQEMLGYSALEIFGRHFTELIHEGDIARGLINFKDLIHHNLRDLRFDHRLYHKDGSVVWAYTTLTSVKRNPTDEGPAFVVGMVDNVTERKKIEFELLEMKSRFQEGVEKERLRLAQELHDGPMQDLHSATYLLVSMNREEPLQQEKLESIAQIIQQVISDLRATARELRPPAIIDFGLEKAIRSHIEDLKENYPEIKFHVDLFPDKKLLPEEIRMALFRVYQSSLANVIRHAAAKDVSVHLSLDAEEIRLEIEDNGKGFKVPPRWILLMRRGHFGLAGAAERIAALGGTFQVESEPDKGTRVLVRLSSLSNRLDERTL